MYTGLKPGPTRRSWSSRTKRSYRSLGCSSTRLCRICPFPVTRRQTRLALHVRREQCPRKWLSKRCKWGTSGWVCHWIFWRVTWSYCQRIRLHWRHSWWVNSHWWKRTDPVRSMQMWRCCYKRMSRSQSWRQKCCMRPCCTSRNNIHKW